MLTLYAPVSGRVEPLAGAGLVILHIGKCVVAAPTRGTVTALDDGGLVLTDLRGRVVEVRLESDAGPALPLVSPGDEVAFDQPLFRWESDAPLRVGVSSRGDADLMVHVEPADEVASGADLFSVGPFSCGA